VVRPARPQAGAAWRTKQSLLATNHALKSPSRRAGDQSDEKNVIVRGALEVLHHRTDHIIELGHASLFGVNVIKLGADSETDINGQIGILAQAVAPIPAAIVIAPAQFAELGKPIDEAAKQVKIIGIESEADSSAFTSFVKTDNVQAGRLAADILADAIKWTYADAEGDVAVMTSSSGVPSFEERASGFKEQITKKYWALDIVAHNVFKQAA
jgi:ABC-type xylose transport system substrate-binding protein